MRLSAPDHNPNRKGGKNLWTDDEMRTLEDGLKGLLVRLPGRSAAAIAGRLAHVVKERAWSGSEADA